MLIRLRNTGAVITEDEFRAANANTSFPQQITAELLNGFGADPVLEGPQPALTRYQTAAMNGVRQDGNYWITNWIAVDMGPEDIAAADARQADVVRSDRNRRLAECDWTQGRDIADQVQQAWVPYRAALRDVPSQPGFPWAVTWPVAPGAA